MDLGDNNVKNNTNSQNDLTNNLFGSIASGANTNNNAQSNANANTNNGNNKIPNSEEPTDILGQLNQLPSINQNKQNNDEDDLIKEVWGDDSNNQPQEPKAYLTGDSNETSNTSPTSTSHMSELLQRKDFLGYLVQKGYLTSAQAEQFKIEAVKSGQPIEKVILKKTDIQAKQLYKEKAAFFHVNFIEDIFSIQLNEKLQIMIKKHIDKVKSTLSFPIDFNEKTGTIKVLIANFLNYNAIQFWRLTFNARNVIVYTGVPEEIEAYIDNKFGNILDTSLAKEVRAIETEANENQIQEDVETKEQKALESTSGVAKLVEQIITNAAQTGASDIHIEPTALDIRVRYRIDGVLKEKFRGISRALLSELVTRIKIMSHLKIDETRLPQDGRIYKVIDGRKFDIRVSTLPTIYGEKVVMRLLERSGHIPKLEELGMQGSAYKKYIEALGLTSGIILITGPTGSGKTTTLAASLARLNKPEVNIISVEDPVEVRIDGITQVQIHSEIGLTFARVLRSILRQDPDIIMVGEIRDTETAHLAIRAALTGHLVLSTLHTNDAPTALPRLIDMGVEPYLVASTVKLVVAQRLVRAICPYSRHEYKPEKALLERILKSLSKIKNFDPFEYVIKRSQEKIQAPPDSREFILHPPVKPPFQYEDGTKGLYLYKGEPHPKCNNSEYKSRLGIYEVLKLDDEIQEMILKEKSANEIRKRAEEKGMLNLLQDGFIRALEGVTTIDEVLRVARA